MDLPTKAKAAREPVELAPSDALSIQKNILKTFVGRRVGILFSEGSDKAAIDSLRIDIEKAGGMAFLVAPKVGGLKVKGGTLKADGQLAGSPSVLFDAVATALAPEQATKLVHEGAAVQWIMDAFCHCKVIAHDAGSQVLLDRAGVEPDDGIVSLGDLVKAGIHRRWTREPKVRQLP
ncbi:MAG: hypothetical protein ACN6OP_13980 [Pseudomonadales bacterium]